MYAFTNCTSLSTIVIPNSITQLERATFQGCTRLASVSIPNTVGYIRDLVFQGCTELASIYIPDGVSLIESSAFDGCCKLKTVKIGKNLFSLNSRAFASCKEITDFYCFAEEVPQAYLDAFSDSYIEYATLHVLEKLIDKYGGKKPWSDFGKIVSITDNDNPASVQFESINDNRTPIYFFSVDGKQSCQPQRGLNIVRMNGGSTRKIMIK